MGTDGTESLAVLEIRNIQTNLSLGRYLIGSGQDCDIIIDDSTVEQRHAFLVVQQHCVKIVDLLTESGTYVDDENICNGKFNDILKSVSIKFGFVDAQLRLIEESDSGFLGFTSRDSLDIIPLSPQESTTVRHNSEMCSSRIRPRKSSFQSEFRTPNTPYVNSSRVDKPVCNDMFLANVTDVNIRRNIEQMTEEDEYYIPETQEIFDKRPQSPKDNSNEGIFRITTQEFKENFDESISSNVMGNVSLDIPLIRQSPILITELKNESPTISRKEQGTRSEEPSAVVDVKSDDTESEISILKWDVSKNNSAAPGRDLDGLKSGEQIKEGSVTPDLELTHIRSGSTTPDLFQANENSTNINIDIEEHLFSPTQIFQPKKSVDVNSNTSSNQEQVPLNVSSNNPDLELTQPFVLREQVNSIRTTNPPDLLKNDDVIFVKPLPKLPITIDADSEEYENSEPTQPFILKDRSKPSTSFDDDDDFEQFAVTQPFEFGKQKHRSVSPALILSSDEDEDINFMETLDVHEIKEMIGMRNSTNKRTSKKGCRQVAQEVDLFDIQSTPCMDYKLPNESVIDNAEKLFNKETNNQRRRSSSFADSLDEDDNVFITKTETREHEKDVVSNSNIVVWLTKDCKLDEAIKEQNLLLSIPKGVQKKDSLSDQSTSSNARSQRRGRPKKRTKSNEKISDKAAKQPKITTSPNLEKTAEDEKMSGEAIRKQKGRKKYTKNTDGKFEETKEEKKEVPLKETRSKRTATSKRVQLKTTPTSRTMRKSQVGYAKTEYGDFPEECQINLRHRTSQRIKSVPSYIVDDSNNTESNMKKKHRKEEKIKQSEEIPKTSRRIAVTKKLKLDPKKCPNLQKSSSDTSLDESETNNTSNEAVLKCSTGKNLIYTSTPSVRKSARPGKHRICFTRVDSSRYVDVMQKTGCMIENDPMTSTVLVAAKITRTWKMLVAIARGLPIVSPDWFKILESNYNESYSYDDYLLQDPSAEQQYRFNLKKSLQAARKKPIFKNFKFFITPQTHPNPAEMAEIIESGGGSVMSRYPRNIQNLSHFYIISTREDDVLWKRFKSDANVPIYSSEAVMSAVMQQCINFKHHQLS